jgi:hypothetical protein
MVMLVSDAGDIGPQNEMKIVQRQESSTLPAPVGRGRRLPRPPNRRSPLMRWTDLTANQEVVVSRMFRE